MTTLQASLPNISRRAAWTRPIPTVLILSLLVVLAGCRGLPVPTFPAAGAFVASELASLAPEGRFDHSVVDFSQAEETSRGVSASGVGFESFTGNIGFGIGVAVAGGQAPPGGRFVGSTEHLRLTGAGSIRLTSPATVLGMYVALTHDEALRHRWIASGEDARLLVSGADRNGNRTGTVKVTPAIGTRDGTYVSEEWMWVDLSILGTVSELEVTFESPMTELPVLLIDNFTFSMNYKSDPDFFTIALLPDSSAYVADAPEILGAQARYLAEESRSRDGEPIVFVSHLGGLVPAEAEEEHWEIVDDAMKLLDRSVPYGVAPAISDFQEAEDPELGSPLYLEIFPPDRFRDQSGRFVPSEDEYSSYRILDTPVGEVLSLHLVVDPSPDTLEWARNVLNRHRTLPTIVTTPSYLEVADGVPGRRLSKVLNNYDDTWQGVPAQTMWEELIWPNDQVFLVACGDGPSEALSIGWNGSEQPVIEMLAAYGDRPDGAEGYLRLLRVYPDRSELRVLTYSPWLDTYEQDADSFFRLPLDISGRLGLE